MEKVGQKKPRAGWITSLRRGLSLDVDEDDFSLSLLLTALVAAQEYGSNPVLENSGQTSVPS